MEKKIVGISATLVTVFLCGCPGLFCLFMGGMFALISFIPNAKIDIFGSHEPRSALTFGLVVLGIGLLFITIPVIIGIVTLRQRKSKTLANFNEPIPPAS